MSIPGQPSFSRELFSPIAQKGVLCICVAHIQLWAVAVCKLPSEPKVAIMPTTILPIMIENIVCFQVLGFLAGRVSQAPSKKSHVVSLRTKVLLRVYVGSYWRRSHQKKTYSSSYHDVKESQRPESEWSLSDELDAVSLSAQSKAF